ncbi:MAG: heat-inducible transcription repressor HrcA [Deltaproteobacteria bacterium]|nr:MAG: heat-inducible transcription repressor HrcA [Deltaproteobacteria bacterium]
MEKIDRRAEIILKAVVEEYVRVAEPVGSRTIAKRIPLNISSATIRNVMSDLEEMGYLYQPHTSAGRIPTSEGFRYYVDRLMEVKELGAEEKEAIAGTIESAEGDALGVLKEASRLLSDMIRQACIVIAPGPDRMILKHISFVRLSKEKMLVILVGKSGLIQNRVFAYDEEISQAELDRISNYLNAEIVEGKTIQEIRAHIVRELKRDRARYDRLMKRALDFSERVVSQSAENVIVEGQTKVFEQPEFVENLERLKQVMRSFEEKSVLLKLLDSTLLSEGVQISIGAENALEEFKDMSLVAAGYRRSDSTLGTIGVIGPVRMDYGVVIPFVEYTAQVLSRIFEEK